MKREEHNDEIQTVYAFAHIECWLGIYAQSHNLSTADLTRRVGELLQAQTGGQVLGVGNRVPEVSRDAPEQRAVLEPMAVVKRSYRRRAQLAAGDEPTRMTAWHRRVDKHAYSDAVADVLARHKNGLPSKQIVETIQLKHPDWSSAQIYGGINSNRRNGRFRKDPVSGVIVLAKKAA